MQQIGAIAWQEWVNTIEQFANGKRLDQNCIRAALIRAILVRLNDDQNWQVAQSLPQGAADAFPAGAHAGRIDYNQVWIDVK
jgi:hypothetical protein